MTAPVTFKPSRFVVAVADADPTALHGIFVIGIFDSVEEARAAVEADAKDYGSEGSSDAEAAGLDPAETKLRWLEDGMTARHGYDGLESGVTEWVIRAA